MLTKTAEYLIGIAVALVLLIIAYVVGFFKDTQNVTASGESLESPGTKSSLSKEELYCVTTQSGRKHIYPGHIPLIYKDGVFATSSKELAYLFIGLISEKQLEVGKSKASPKYYIKELAPSAFLNLQCPGTIYIVNKSDFKQDNSCCKKNLFGLEEYCFISDKKITPLREEEHIPNAKKAIEATGLFELIPYSPV